MGVIDVLEWVGTIFSLVGAFMLAVQIRISRYGWLAFFIANLAMIVFALGIQRYGLFVQQIGFMVSSLIGLYRTGLIKGLLRFIR